MRPILLFSVSLPLLLGSCGEKSSPEDSESVHENSTPPREEAEPEEPITENELEDAVSVNPNLKYEIKGDEVTITDCDEGVSGKVVIPAAIEGKSVTGIGDRAFQKCIRLTSATIPDSVTSIGAGAFNTCSVTSIIFGEKNQLMSIGGDAFSNCPLLTEITIPESVTSIGPRAFDSCRSLISITIPDRVGKIGPGAFRDCIGLTSIKIPDSITGIEFRTFDRCRSLTTITIPDGVTSIGDNAFKECSNLTTVTLLGDAPKAGEKVFEKSFPTVYRNPETTGWGDMFAGRPVKLISERP